MADPMVDNAPESEDAQGSVSSKVNDVTDPETATAVSEESVSADNKQNAGSGPIVSSNKKTRPPYKFDPSKITLRFLFANRDGLTVTIECNPSDTVGEVKGSLMSVWPEGLPPCSGGDQLRLVCMGKGYLMPDTRTLEECEIPVFKTHPTPINVSLRQETKKEEDKNTVKKKELGSQASNRGPGRSGQSSDSAAAQAQVSQGCSCILL